ncbi:hypothetical protein Q73_06595 [Bacillus coahuilensis m2-6]|nr:hypothetical protein Q73_06595 [Bacillus coahuilensis m2-6]
MHYDRRFDLGIAYGKSPNEIVTYLGTPKKVVYSFSEQRISIQNNHSSNQSISLGDKDLGRLSQKIRITILVDLKLKQLSLELPYFFKI